MFCLTIVFIVVALVCGLTVGSVVRSSDASVVEFFNQVLSAMSVGTYAIVVFKPLLIGMIPMIIAGLVGLAAITLFQ